jgi:Omp85 superfamily domain
MRLVPVIALCLLLLAPVHAQQVSAPEPAIKPEETSLFGKVSNIFNGPLHPIIKGVVASGGLGVGLSYDFPATGRWETVAQAVVTVRRYWSAELQTAYRGEHGRVAAYGRLREMSQLSYFGPGLQSDVRDRTNFLLRDPVIGAVASARIADWMAAGVRVEELWPNVGSGVSAQHPSVEDRFAEVDAPGLNAQPRFGRYQGFVELQAPASVGQNLNQGGRYRIGYALFNDQQFDRFSFTRVDVEARHKFAVFGPHRRLTLHGWLAATEPRSGNSVPFYMQPTLGGTGQLRSVGEDLIGSDGSRGTLRGFDNYRFRDLNLMLLQAEYRVPVWGPFDASVFVDAGKVAPRRADLNLSDLKHDYGFGISVMRGPNTVARTDFGFGSEGAKILVSFGLSDEFLR